MLNALQKIIYLASRNPRLAASYLFNIDARAIKFINKSNIRCYFITGTGRCGTMLLARLLSLGENTSCYHEVTPVYKLMEDSYLNDDLTLMKEQVYRYLKPRVLSHNLKGLSFGESSGLIYMLFLELYRNYGERVRFILLTRHPVSYVRSALARGFFVKDHEFPVEHLRAKPNTEIGKRWEKASPFEKNLWYWRTVNEMVYDFFQQLPRNMWMIQPIEELDVNSAIKIFKFLGIHVPDTQRVKGMLKRRINASPGQNDERYLNPRSEHIKLGDFDSWTADQMAMFSRWISPVIGTFYPNATGER